MCGELKCSWKFSSNCANSFLCHKYPKIISNISTKINHLRAKKISCKWLYYYVLLRIFVWIYCHHCKQYLKKLLFCALKKKKTLIQFNAKGFYRDSIATQNFAYKKEEEMCFGRIQHCWLSGENVTIKFEISDLFSVNAFKPSISVNFREMWFGY